MPITPTPFSLGDQIAELAAQIAAASCQLLELIRDFDEQGGWHDDGALSCAHWLNWRCGIGIVAAREKVRVAHALKHLPLIHDAFANGAVSYSKVRAMTRVATPENEDYLLMIARHGTAAHVETLVRQYRRAVRSEELAAANDRHAARELSWYTDDDGMLVITARLSPEDGVRVLHAIEAKRDALLNDGVREETSEISFHAQRADALVALAAEGARADTELVVHIDAAVLADDGAPGRAELEDGPCICPETVRRLGCDCGVVEIVENAHGEPLSVGRKTRSIPPAIRRALRSRDRGCRFPGCTRTHHVEGHHIRHWSRGGETALENLVQLCYYHHRLVHEGGFQVARTDDGAFRFTRPDGTRVTDAPRPSRLQRLAADCLRTANRQRGLQIEAKTNQCLWDGVPMDHDLAVAGLIQATGEFNTA